MRRRDEPGPLFRDADFAGCCGRRGRPGYSPAVLMLVLLLRFIENLTDVQAAEAVAGTTRSNPCELASGVTPRSKAGAVACSCRTGAICAVRIPTYPVGVWWETPERNSPGRRRKPGAPPTRRRTRRYRRGRHPRPHSGALYGLRFAANLLTRRSHGLVDSAAGRAVGSGSVFRDIRRAQNRSSSSGGTRNCLPSAVTAGKAVVWLRSQAPQSIEVGPFGPFLRWHRAEPAQGGARDRTRSGAPPKGGSRQ
jgi:hypothetical protein